jgi:hypothetical protein
MISRTSSPPTWTRGLEMARLHAQVDWDDETGEWFIPGDAVTR